MSSKSTTKQKGNVCYGCSREWNEKSLYCTDCQQRGVGTAGANAGLAGLAIQAASTIYEQTLEDCHKCGAPNTVLVKGPGWFCQDCMKAKSWNSYLQKYTGV